MVAIYYENKGGSMDEIESGIYKLYGIAFVANQKDGLCSTKRFHLNAYFTDMVEAFKVIGRLNELEQTKRFHKHYSITIQSLAVLKRKKELAEQDKRLKREQPALFHRMTNYHIFKSAEQYFEFSNELEVDRTTLNN